MTTHPIRHWTNAARAAAVLLISALTLSAETVKAEVFPLDAFDAASAETVDHSAWSAFLGAYVVEGEDGINRVRYGDVTVADRTALNAYIAALENIEVTALNRPEQFAYWVNLYNAATIRVVLENYPVDSIRDIKPNVLAFGPWKMNVVEVMGRKLSLDNIAHDILRVAWDEPRVHYAVNCASVGCPNLAVTAYTGAALEDMLDAAARGYINHPRGARVTDRGLVVSSIYDWYKEDFGGSDAGVIAHLKAYADANLAADLAEMTAIADHAYDWSLNDASGTGG